MPGMISEKAFPALPPRIGACDGVLITIPVEGHNGSASWRDSFLSEPTVAQQGFIDTGGEKRRTHRGPPPGDFKAARELYEQVLVARKRVFGENHPDTKAAAQNLREVVKALGY